MESVVLDIKDDEDRAILLRMLEKADVFIRNLLPGALTKLGLIRPACAPGFRAL